MITLALEKLVDDVAARFVADGTECNFHFGWREPVRQGPIPRIVWVPGDPQGSAGDIGPPKYPGISPARPLANLNEAFTVHITAEDASDSSNERLQWKAARLLFDSWLRAVYLAAYGTFALSKPLWNRSKTERQRGATLIVVGAIGSMIPDEIAAVAPVNTHASLTTELLDVSDPAVTVVAS